MFDLEKIKNRVELFNQSIDIPFNQFEIENAIDKAINKGAELRESTIEFLKNEKKDYTTTLISMVTTSLQLKDKLGMISTSENGVSNTFESGGSYLKEDLNAFKPLLHGLNKLG